MTFEERKKRGKKLEKEAGEYLKQHYKDYRIEQQRVFSSGRRPDYWLVSKRNHRDRIAVEVKDHSEAGVARESDLKQLRMYQHQGIAERGVIVYPDSVRVPHKVRRQARKSGQDIVRLSNDNCFIATAAFGTPLANEINLLRRFRDQRLLLSARGREFVRLYYLTSPSIAAFVTRSNYLRAMIRVLIRALIALISATGKIQLRHKICMW